MGSIWAALVSKDRLAKVLAGNSFLNRFGLAVGGAAAPIQLVLVYTPGQAGLFQSTSVVALLAGSFLGWLIPHIPLAGVFDAWNGIGNALSYLALALGPHIGLPVGLRATSYVAQSLSSPRMNAYAAEQFDDHERGRIYAAIQGVGSVLAPAGMLIGSLLLTPLGPRPLLIAGAGLTLLFTALPTPTSPRRSGHKADE
jgi:MFS family permease